MNIREGKDKKPRILELMLNLPQAGYRDKDL